MQTSTSLFLARHLPGVWLDRKLLELSFLNRKILIRGPTVGFWFQHSVIGNIEMQLTHLLSSLKLATLKSHKGQYTQCFFALDV